MKQSINVQKTKEKHEISLRPNFMQSNCAIILPHSTTYIFNEMCMLRLIHATQLAKSIFLGNFVDVEILEASKRWFFLCSLRVTKFPMYTNHSCILIVSSIRIIVASHMRVDFQFSIQTHVMIHFIVVDARCYYINLFLGLKFRSAYKRDKRMQTLRNITLHASEIENVWQIMAAPTHDYTLALWNYLRHIFQLLIILLAVLLISLG